MFLMAQVQIKLTDFVLAMQSPVDNLRAIAINRSFAEK
jgi:hypothetical protein